MNIRPVLLRSLLAATALFVAHAAQATISDDFASGDGGWRIVDLAGAGNYTTVFSTFAPTYASGSISAFDPSANSFYFDAPAKYTGNLSGYLGGTLRFDTAYTPNEPGNAWRDDPDVVLTSGTTHLVWQAATNPGADWTPVSVVLAAGQGWRVGSLGGRAATAEEMASVLGNLSSLRIRGEYVSGILETTRLDNVALVPEPESWAMLLAGLGMIGALARRQVGIA